MPIDAKVVRTRAIIDHHEHPTVLVGRDESGAIFATLQDSRYVDLLIRTCNILPSDRDLPFAEELAYREESDRLIGERIPTGHVFDQSVTPNGADAFVELWDTSEGRGSPYIDAPSVNKIKKGANSDGA